MLFLIPGVCVLLVGPILINVKRHRSTRTVFPDSTEWLTSGPSARSISLLADLVLTCVTNYTFILVGQ